MQEVDKILYKLGYYDADTLKRDEVQGYIDEAVEFMKSCGVPDNKMTTQTAYAVKSIWADSRDKDNPDSVVKKDGMVIALISQLKR